jgi:hypothetical protein
MKTQSYLARAAACLLLAAGTQAHAQQALQAAADPQASVPAIRYQSALDKHPEAAPTASPDANWVASNQAVAATDSMALTMKGMDGGHQQAADPHAAHAGPAMCAPGTGAGGKGMQCMSGDQAGDGKMSCCPSCCQTCCKDKMKKDKENP